MTRLPALVLTSMLLGSSCGGEGGTGPSRDGDTTPDVSTGVDIPSGDVAFTVGSASVAMRGAEETTLGCELSPLSVSLGGSLFQAAAGELSLDYDCDSGSLLRFRIKFFEGVDPEVFELSVYVSASDTEYGQVEAEPCRPAVTTFHESAVEGTIRCSSLADSAGSGSSVSAQTTFSASA